MVLRIVIIIGFISMINPIQAQRMLGGEKGIQIAIGVPLNDTGVFTENYNVQLAITRNTTLGNYWKFEAGYYLQTFDYKAYQIPYELFNGAIGYFLQTFSNHKKSMLVYTGLSGVVGYEVFNKDIALLQDGATLHNKSGVVYGGKGTLSIESYLSNHLVVFGFYEMSFIPKSGLTKWHSQIGMGTRIFIN